MQLPKGRARLCGYCGRSFVVRYLMAPQVMCSHSCARREQAKRQAEARKRRCELTAALGLSASDRLPLGYSVDEYGVVTSTLKGKPRVVAPSRDQKGYLVVRVNGALPGRRVRRWVHVLVATAFHGSRPSPEHEVRHLDGCKTNNRADNLAWGTAKENAMDRERHGRTRRGALNGRSHDARRRRQMEGLHASVAR